MSINNNNHPSRVKVIHIPTGESVACDLHKQQHRNKALALKALKCRLLALQATPKEYFILCNYNLPPDIQHPDDLEEYKKYIA